MKKYIPLFISLLILLVLGVFYLLNRDTESTPKEGWLTYGNPALGFRVNYPDATNPIVSERDLGVSFRSDDSGPWMFDVGVSSTSAATTREWIESQPLGDFDHVGIRFLSNLGREPDMYLYTETVRTDHAGADAIYGQYVKAAYVSQGKLFTIQSNDYQSVDESPIPETDFMEMVKTFRLLK